MSGYNEQGVLLLSLQDFLMDFEKSFEFLVKVYG